MLRPAVLQLQLGDEEQIDERLARRAHELEGRLAKFGAAGIQKPKDLLEFVNDIKYKVVGGQQLEAGRSHFCLLLRSSYCMYYTARGWLYYV